MRHFDHTVNITWVMQHLNVAHILSIVEGHGRGDRRKWLEKYNPKYQRRIFSYGGWGIGKLGCRNLSWIKKQNTVWSKQIILIVFTSIYRAKESNNKLEIKTKVKTVKPIAENSDFGFNYSEFNVVQDTIKKGDNFGTISEQNIGDRKVFEIVKVLEIL
jgi:hypothetical protein